MGSGGTPGMNEAPGAGEGDNHDATHRKGCQMRYRATFIAGFVVGFIAGARAGRERYDQIVKYTKQVVESPPVQKATSTVAAKATELGKTAAAKAPDFALRRLLTRHQPFRPYRYVDQFTERSATDGLHPRTGRESLRHVENVRPAEHQSWQNQRGAG